jgi:glycosyltransferase involved in cell wall biosynthesis
MPLGEWKDSHILVFNFLQVLVSIAEEVCLITGNYPEDDLPSPKIQLTNVRNDQLTTYPKRRLITRAVKYIATQLKMSYRLTKIASQVDIVIFFIGGSGLLLPMLVAKLRRKKTIIVAVDAGAVAFRNIYRQTLWGMGGLITYGIISVLQRLNYQLCDKIIVYSPILVQEFGLERYEHKISIAHWRFLDFARFKVQKPLNERDNVVGYIGRLSQEKGILNFMAAIPKVAKTRDEATFLIIGAGQLRPRVEEYANKLNKKVKLVNWVRHDELPDYLNELKLLVLPSYTEGLPGIVLEAMACGTPVLATPVGAMLDIIKDGETGLIMENNSPKCIAQNIVRALDNPNLEQIAGNARTLVEREFTHEAAVEKYRWILNCE